MEWTASDITLTIVYCCDRNAILTVYGFPAYSHTPSLFGGEAQDSGSWSEEIPVV